MDICPVVRLCAAGMDVRRGSSFDKSKVLIAPRGFEPLSPG